MREPLMFRRGIRWAKVSGPFDGRWHVACGWRGEVSASPLNRQKWPTKAGAIVGAKGWINDASETELAIGRRKDAEDKAEEVRLAKLLGHKRLPAEMRKPRYKSK